MNLFQKTNKMIIYSETQKDELVEKLEQAHVTYSIKIKEDTLTSSKPYYELRIASKDFAKVS